MIELLKRRHSHDVVVPECKDGPTQSRKHYRFDLWVMRRSWSPLTMIGYELKTTRSDFLADEKWQRGLELCHQFFFVCPYGLIKPEEVPYECGLIQVSKTWKRLRTVRRAPRREIEVPVDLLLYVLMARSYIVPGGGFALEDLPREARVLELRRRLEEHDREREALRAVVADRVREEWERLDRTARDALDRCDRMEARNEAVESVLRDVGVDVDANPWSLRQALRRRLQALNSANLAGHLIAAAETVEGTGLRLRDAAAVLQKVLATGLGVDDER